MDTSYILICDFCGEKLPSIEGSAFCDGSAFSDIGYDDRIACSNCIGKLTTEDQGQ
tara:strand:+ start:675 stop:842 length:168 start_codon:yes stop_codon:yes gene_type:complete